MRRTILSVILTIVFAGVAQADKLQEPFDRTLDVHAGTPVSIDNVNGRIIVTTWDQPRVRIHAIRKAESREALDKLTIDIRQNGDGLSIATCRRRMTAAASSIFCSATTGMRRSTMT